MTKPQWSNAESVQSSRRSVVQPLKSSRKKSSSCDALEEDLGVAMGHTKIRRVRSSGGLSLRPKSKSASPRRISRRDRCQIRKAPSSEETAGFIKRCSTDTAPRPV